jgi:hypothetical protein
MVPTSFRGIPECLNNPTGLPREPVRHGKGVISVPFWGKEISMVRVMGWILGGVFLTGLVGCSFDSFSLFTAGKPHDEQIFNEKIELVELSFEQMLTKNVVKYSKVDSEPGTVKLLGTTLHNEPFTLLLKKAKSDHGDKTLARIEWDKMDNEYFWTTLVQMTTQNLSTMGSNAPPAGVVGTRETMPSLTGPQPGFMDNYRADDPRSGPPTRPSDDRIQQMMGDGK